MTKRKMLNKRALEDLRSLQEKCDSNQETGITYAVCVSINSDGSEAANILVVKEATYILDILEADSVSELSEKFDAFLKGKKIG